MIPNGGTFLVEDANILPFPFKNFEGREGQYNREGDRQFSITLDPDLAQEMLDDGWNVKRLKAREVDGEMQEGDYYITIAVGYKAKPPKLVLLSSKGRVDLGQHECEILDWVDIAKADVMIRARHYDINGKQGVKAWLKSIFVTLEEDYLDRKYADVEYAELDAAGNPRLAIESGKPREVSEEEEDDDIVDGEVVG